VQKIFVACAFCLTSVMSAPALASVIYTYNAGNPVTNAGPLPASSLNLTAVLVDTIFGNLGPDLNAVNVFGITILHPSIFSAMTVNVGAHGAPDTELFLFNSSGRAVYSNDDITASNTLSCLTSASVSNPCPSSAGGLAPVPAGTYYLAITRSNQLPWDASNNYLFTSAVSSTDVVGPDLSAGGANPVAGWDRGAFTDPNFDNSFYEIALTGTTPEPGTFLMFAGAGIMGVLLRRRRCKAPASARP
jgi:hypothetical protein